MVSNHLILCCPLLLLPSIFPRTWVFSNELALCIRWPKYWSFSINLSNEYLGLISFWIACFDLLVVQGTLKSLLQHHNSKASILQRSALFMVELSHMYMITGKTIALTRRTHMYMITRKTIALTRRTIVSKVLSWLFNMLLRFVIVFLPRSKHLLISCN